MIRRFAFLGIVALVAAAVVATLHGGAAADPAVVDRAFGRFLNALDNEAAGQLVNELIESGVTFEDAYARLKHGRSYSQAVPRGLQRRIHRTADGLNPEYAIIVPENYNASRAYQVRVQLHGGVSGPRYERAEQFDRIVGSPDQIYVHPTGWSGAQWWYANQVENINGILDALRRTYNVDENRIYLTGISDGGTGAYFMAFRDTTPWASFLPLNGDLFVLANVEADGDMYPGNAVNKPFFIVNGGRDPLYPAAVVEPDIEHLRSLGTEVVYHPQPEAGHNTDWWPIEKDSFERFVHEHPRDPLPDRLSWEAERTDRYNRAHWLIIDVLGAVAGESQLADTNLAGGNPVAIGVQIFPRQQPSGRVDLVRMGNTVQASTKGVRTFTLLLSPDEFDFAAPIIVLTNGHVAFEGRLEKSVPTLLKWAAHDNDRTMLFGAELKIQVK